MYSDDAAALRGRLRMLETETCQYALMHLEEIIPRGSFIDLSRLPYPLMLWSVEWVTARFVHIQVTDLYWNDEDEPTGTADDLMLGGESVWLGATPGPSDASGRITHPLCELQAEHLCTLLDIAERITRIIEIEQLVSAGSWVDLSELSRPIIIPPTRRTPGTIQVSGVGWLSTADTAGPGDLIARVTPLRRQCAPYDRPLLDGLIFPNWRLVQIADALHELRGASQQRAAHPRTEPASPACLNPATAT